MFDKAEPQDDAREPFFKPSLPEDWEEELSKGRMNVWRRINYSTMAFHCLVALVYLSVITSTGWMKTSGSTPCSSTGSATDIFAPAEEAIEYQLIDFPLRTFYHNNPFVGDPRPEHDEAWRKLLQNMNVRFTSEEMQKMNLTSLKLKDGSGYVGSFTAYHEIHCVHWIRKWMHRDHYWPYLEGDTLQERKIHIEHCLEDLRLNAMCRGNRIVSTFEWMGAFPRPAAEQKHNCINWEKFDAWNAKRRVDLFDVDALEGRPPVSPGEVSDIDVRLGSKPGSRNDSTHK